jgi:hypothetical protein
MRPPGRRRLPRKAGLHFYTGKQYAVQGAGPEDGRGTPEAGRDPAARVEFQKKAGRGRGPIPPSTLHPAFEQPPDYREAVRDASRVYNDWLAEFISTIERGLGAAMIHGRPGGEERAHVKQGHRLR